ncbi:hypothetical protein KFK09_011961 [Dendrobium nobile]|uniref:Reverse transcriptase zinc-binding domain-containing protein n=1 Tax=Dendrobium nobile TaxID=94219 RepID=A0A8T3BE22_DENNO|nr:hypothetical protein KFK09_011961 [Dendrobium nobile]
MNKAEYLTDRKMHIISWKSVVKPKIKGGLGIPSLDSLYHGVACSLIWRLYNSKSLLGLWFKENYESPWKPPPTSASNFWKLICNKASTLRDSISFKVGLNSYLSIFWDPWFFGTSLGNSLVCHSRNGCWVKDIILNGVWNVPAGWSNDICGKIQEIAIEEEDELVWVGVTKPIFKNFTALFYSDMDNVDWCKFIWHKKHALRYACYAWMAIQGKLKTADSLIRRSIPAPPYCNFCLEHFENHSHLFFGCDFTFEVLSKLLPAVNGFYLRPNLFQFFCSSFSRGFARVFFTSSQAVRLYLLRLKGFLHESPSAPSLLFDFDRSTTFLSCRIECLDILIGSNYWEVARCKGNYLSPFARFFGQIPNIVNQRNFRIY